MDCASQFPPFVDSSTFKDSNIISRRSQRRFVYYLVLNWIFPAYNRHNFLLFLYFPIRFAASWKKDALNPRAVFRSCIAWIVKLRRNEFKLHVFGILYDGGDISPENCKKASLELSSRESALVHSRTRGLLDVWITQIIDELEELSRITVCFEFANVLLVDRIRLGRQHSNDIFANSGLQWRTHRYSMIYHFHSEISNLLDLPHWLHLRKLWRATCQRLCYLE